MPLTKLIPFYIKQQKQIFCSIRWVEQNGRKITIIRRELTRIKNSIETQTHDFQTTILLAVVQETLLTRGTEDNRRQGLLQSINTDIPYTQTNTKHQAQLFKELVEMYVLFLENDICINLDQTWPYKLLEQIETLDQQANTWDVLDIIYPLPLGLYRAIGLYNMYIKTQYVNLNMRGFTIDTAINRTDFQITVSSSLWFEVDGSALRIIVLEDCPILILSIFRRHSYNIAL